MKKLPKGCRWVTRDGGDADVIVHSGTAAPVQYPGYDWPSDYQDSIIRRKEFRRLFGFLPPTDKPILVRFTAEVVEVAKKKARKV